MMIMFAWLTRNLRVQVVFDFELDVENLPSGGAELSVDLQVTTKSENVPAPGHSPALHLILPVVTEIDVAVVGYVHS